METLTLHAPQTTLSRNGLLHLKQIGKISWLGQMFSPSFFLPAKSFRWTYIKLERCNHLLVQDIVLLTNLIAGKSKQRLSFELRLSAASTMPSLLYGFPKNPTWPFNPDIPCLLHGFQILT